MKKLLAVGVIVLFLGLAIAPSINDNISKASIESELVEITTEICGINGFTPNTVSLSKEDAEEVDALFDSIRERLNATETREDTEQIFNEAVVELDKYGLLGGLSVKQAQRLVNGGYQNSRILKFLWNIFSRKQGRSNSDDWWNYNCYVYEKGGYIWFRICFPGFLFVHFNLDMAWFAVLKGLIFYHPLKPISFFNYVHIWTEDMKAELFTDGSEGVKNTTVEEDKDIVLYGFTGITIVYTLPNDYTFNLGWAIAVNYGDLI